jgi:signal transduction histidine kinase
VFVWYTAPVHGHDGTSLGRLFVFRDATREREVDRMKTEFVSLVSHELRTPLTSIRGFADLILDGEAGAVPSSVREYVDIIKLNAERLASLVSNILDLSRIESGRIDLVRENFQPVAFIEPAAASLRPMVESRQQKFIVKIAPDLPAVWVDRDRMVQIIINLLANATKYTDRYGTLTLEARLLQTGDPMPPGAPSNLRLPVVLVGVHDTGIGISAHDRAMVFERFYRTNEAARQQIAGSGLGLTIVRSFVELHGGQVWIDSEVGRGSSFYFTIPLAEGF